MKMSKSPLSSPLFELPDNALESWVVDQANAIGLHAVVSQRLPELLEASRATRANLAALSDELQRIGAGERPDWEL